MSSLTVARQRGICTRFPVFAERRRRAFLGLERAERRNEGKSEGSEKSNAVCAQLHDFPDHRGSRKALTQVLSIVGHRTSAVLPEASAGGTICKAASHTSL